MKKTLYLFIFSCLLQIAHSQTIRNEALNLRPQKVSESSNPNVVYMDADKVFNLPSDGAFLYSSLEGETGIISSGYNNNEDHIVTIKNQYQRRIFIRSQYFLCENGDKLRIYDGSDTTAPLIKTASGILDANFLVLSSGEIITLRFSSDNSGTSKGYRLRLDNGPTAGSRPAPSLPNPMACASTPAADECVNAPLICDLNGYCGNTSGSYTAGNTSGLGNFCGSIENNSWLSFVASGTSASLAFNSAGCQDNSSGIQAVIYASTNCTSFTEVSNCESQGSGSGSFTITTNVNLVPGQTYYVMVDGFAGNICSYTVTAQAGVALGQQITGPSQVCPGYSATLGSSSTASSYSWASTPPGVYPNTQTITVTPTVTTTYTLTLGPSACTPTGTAVVKTVVVTNTLNPANITAPNPICMGTSITLASLTNGGTYAWTGPGGFTANTQNATIPSWSTANNGVYTLNISYGPGCATAPATINLTGTPSPTINIAAAPSLTVCNGQSVVLTGSGGTGVNGYTWNWNFLQTTGTTQFCITIPFVGTSCSNSPLSIPGIAAGPSATFTPNQNTQICVSSENAAGCAGSKCVNIVVLPAAGSLTISPTVTICPGQSTPLTISGGSTYTWSPAATLSSANGATVTASPLVTTTYTVSSPGCSSTQTKTVQVVVNGVPPAIGAISGTTVICANATGLTYSVNNVASTNYTWTVPAGASITSGANTNAITVNFGAAAGTVSVIAVASCGTATAALNVSLSPALNLTVTPANTNICAGSSATLTASGATNYTWSPAASLSSSTGSVVTATPATTTTYTVLGATGTCTGSATATVSLSGGLTLTVTPTLPAVCSGGSATLTATGATNYTWSPAATLSSSTGSVVTANPATATTYTIICTTGACTGSVTTSVSLSGGSLTLTVTANTPTVCPGSSALLNATGAASYTWSPSSTLNSANGAGVTSSPLANTVYTVTGSSGGCVGTSNIAVNIATLGCIPTSCNLAAIRSALTSAGNIELLGMNNSCSLYFINPQFMSGPQAQAYAQTFGANLISVQSAAENADLLQALSNQGYSSNVVWIGFSDAISEGSFVWYDGAPITYTNWAVSEPNDAGGNEDCTQIYPDGTWNDLPCTGLNSLSVIEVNLCPQVTVANVPIHCPNTNVTLTASTLLGSPSYTYTWIQSGTETFTNTSTPGNTDKITVTSTGANTFTVYSQDRYACPKSTSISLSVTPTPTITANSSTICLGQQTASLTANGAVNYTWTPSATLSSGTGTSVTATPVATTIYTITGSDANTCINTGTAAVTVINTPTLSVTANTTICPGGVATLTVSGAVNYTWSPSGSLSSGIGSSVTANPATTTIYTVTGANSNGCTATNTVQVTIGSTPTITAITNATVCPATSTTLTANGGATYTWTPSATLSSGTGANVTATPTTNITYTVTGANAGGCINTATVSVSIAPNPTITASANTTICPSGSSTLTVSGATNYTWSPAGSLNTANGGTVISTPAGTTTYTITGANATGCAGTGTVMVTVAPNPTITTTPNATVCPNSANTLVASGATSYTWSPAFFLSTTTSATVISTPTTSTTYTITGLTGICSSTTALTLVVSNTVVVNAATANPTICPLASATLTASGATSYTWTPTLTLNTGSGGTVTATPSINQTYTVIGAAGTCTNSAQIAITVTVNPTVSVAPVNPICSGETTALTASGASTYTWLPTTNLNTGTGSSVNANPPTTAIYTVTGSSPLGCKNFTTVTLNVIPIPTISISSGSLTICDGESTSLSAFGSATGSYTWSASPAGPISNINANPVTVTPTTTTTYTVIGTNGILPKVCPSAQAITINVIPKTIALAPKVDPICFGSSTILNATGGNRYSWAPATGLSNPNDSVTGAMPLTSTIYTVTVSKNGLCPGTATLGIVVNPLPYVYAGRDTTINIDENVVLTGTGNVDVGFLSPNSTPLICNFCPVVTVAPDENTCYVLMGTNQYGCLNTDTVCVTVTRDWNVYIPNAFTPNADNYNDVFIPVGYGLSEISLTIFNRWGSVIFKSNGDNIGWDGTSKGKLCEQGVYIYQAEIKTMAGNTVKRTGHVTLLSKIR